MKEDDERLERDFLIRTLLRAEEVIEHIIHEQMGTIRFP
jgi:hypothetical protein